MNPPVTMFHIPSGDGGAYRTLSIMKRVVQEAVRTVPVIEMAKSIIRPVGGKNRQAQAETLAHWLRTHVRFVRDPYGIETIYAPMVVLDRIRSQGFAEMDCDDYAVLGASLAKAIGLRTKFVVLSFRDGASYEHVYTIAQTERGWVPFDQTFGQPPGQIVRRAYYEV